MTDGPAYTPYTHANVIFEMKKGNEVTFVGLKSQQDLISERVQAADKNGDIINVDVDDDGQDHTKDDEANSCIKKRSHEHVGESSSDSNSSDDQRISPTEEEKAMLKCEESCTENEEEHESAQEGIDNEEVDNEKAEVTSHKLLQLYAAEAKEAELTCPQCDKGIQRQDDSMACTDCPRVYHNECLENEFNIVASDIMDNEPFVCPICKKLQGGKSSRSDDSDYVEDEAEAEAEAENVGESSAAESSD